MYILKYISDLFLYIVYNRRFSFTDSSVYYRLFRVNNGNIFFKHTLYTIDDFKIREVSQGRFATVKVFNLMAQEIKRYGTGPPRSGIAKLTIRRK